MPLTNQGILNPYDMPVPSLMQKNRENFEKIIEEHQQKCNEINYVSAAEKSKRLEIEQ